VETGVLSAGSSYCADTVADDKITMTTTETHAEQVMVMKDKNDSVPFWTVQLAFLSAITLC